MQKAVIWGAGSAGRRILNMSKDSYEVICFVDSDPSKHNTKVSQNTERGGAF